MFTIADSEVDINEEEMEKPSNEFEICDASRDAHYKLKTHRSRFKETQDNKCNRILI